MNKVKIAIDINGNGVLLEGIDNKFQDSLASKLESLDLSSFKSELYHLYYSISQYEISINDIKPISNREAYVCGITFDHELGETRVDVHKSIESLNRNMKCADSGECAPIKLKIYED